MCTDSLEELSTLLTKSKTASIDVDCPKGFTPLCPDELPVPDGHTIVTALNEQAELAKYRVGTKDAHPEGAAWDVSVHTGPILSPVGLPDVDVRWPIHCVVGTKGFDLLDGLPKPMEYDFFVYKGVEKDVHPYGACYHNLSETRSTGLIEWLNSKGVVNVLVGGLALDYCVKTTAVQLARAGFNVFVNTEACRAVNEETAKSAIAEMEAVGIAVL